MKFITNFLGITDTEAGPTIRRPDKAVYKSPSGKRIPFSFTDVDLSISTKASVFENAAGDGTYVQSNGHTSGRFPMVAIFHGNGFEEKAESFFAALLEPGVGQLSHPSYRVPINVLPVGEIGRSDAYVSAAGQIKISVSFFETTGLLIGETGSLPQLYDSFVDASSVDFSEKTRLSTATDRKNFINKVRETAKKIEMVMKAASRGIGNATQAIEDAGDSINRGMSLLVGQPLALARQTQILISEPRRQHAGVRAKWEGYKNLSAQIFTGIADEPSKYSNEKINNFHMDKLTASSIIANSAMLLTGGADEYTTRADYIEMAEGLRDLLDNFQNWSDDNYDALAETNISESATDTGGGIGELQKLVGYALSDLITMSFSAKTEIRMALENDRTPIDLCFELYGTTEFGTMDLFLYSNGINGDEHILIERGREIVWYV